MTLQRCQFVALDERWFDPSIRMLTAMKLMDVIVTTLAQSTRDTGFSLEEDAATVVNKLPTSSPICDHCDIFAAPRGDPYSRLRSSHHRGGPYSFQT